MAAAWASAKLTVLAGLICVAVDGEILVGAAGLVLTESDELGLADAKGVAAGVAEAVPADVWSVTAVGADVVLVPVEVAVATGAAVTSSRVS